MVDRSRIVISQVNPVTRKFSRPGALTLLAILIAWLVPLTAWTASLTATVERKTVIDGESVMLYIEGEDLKSLPDTSALNQHFDILDSRSSNSQILGSNGVQSKFTVRFELIAKNLGATVIPAFEADGYLTQPITIEVVERGTPGTAPRDNVFAEVTLSDESPYVQAQVVLSLHIFDDGSLASADPVIPTIANVQIEALPVGKQRIEERDSVEYRVHTWRFALFPQKSGIIEIPRMQIVGSVKDPGYGGNLILRNTPTRRISVRSQPVTLEVRSKPSQSTARWWLPAGQVELRHKWSEDLEQARVGDPLTLALQLTAKGTTSTQLPEIVLPDVPGLKIYPDVPELVSQPNTDGLISQRNEKWSIIPQRAGVLEIPPVRFKWWDTVADLERETVFPAQTLTVAAAENAGTAVTPSEPIGNSPISATAAVQPIAADKVADSELVDAPADGETGNAAGLSKLLPDRDNAWMWVALFLAIGWMTTTLFWLLTGRRKRMKVSVEKPVEADDRQQRQGLKDLKILSRSGSAAAFRQSLMSWAALRWPDQPPLNLQEVGDRMHDSELKSGLRELDSAVYSRSNAAVALGEVYNCLIKSIEQSTRKPKKSADDPLPRL